MLDFVTGMSNANTPKTEAQLFWPTDLWIEAVETLSREANLNSKLGANELPKLHDQTMLLNSENVELIANYLGIESEPMRVCYAETEDVLTRGAPMLLVIGEKDTHKSHLLLVLYCRKKQVCVLTPTLKRKMLTVGELHNHLCAQLEAKYTHTFDAVLDKAALPPQQRERVYQNLLRKHLADMEVSRGWQLRLVPSASLIQQTRDYGIAPLLVMLMGAILLIQLSITFSWVLLGQSIYGNTPLDASNVNLGNSLLGAWALIIISALPIQLLAYTASGKIAILIGAAYRNTLLYGALKLHPNEIRHQGAGEFLSRTLDANAIQQGTMWAVFDVLYAFNQIVSAFIILAVTDSTFVSAGFLAGMFLLQLIFTVIYRQDYNLWQNGVRYITNRLVENMIGYRTRIAQQRPAEWHEEEDRDLADYYRLSIRHLRFRTALDTMSQIWIALGMAGLMWSFSQATLSQTEIAVRLGAILLAYQGLEGMAVQILTFTRLSVAWDQVKPILSAARRLPERGLAALLARRPKSKEMGESATLNQAAHNLITAHNVSFRYADRGRLALNQINLQINTGDRFLIEGPSGGGKSTLASVLAGLNTPESGLLLLHGFDRASMGLSAWRKSVVMVPQFHENYVFVGTFSFNLLMGRHWPPSPEDEQAAIEICKELGLDSLIERMPSGMQQIVGESGWQLSHGEKSRLFIARALLQKSDLLILDESFGALDPENMARAMQCVLRHAPTMIVIAHP